MKTFDLIVEGKSDDPTQVAKPALHLTRLEWEGESPPDIVVLPQGLALVKVARYLAAGNQYRYRVATVARLTDKGNLEIDQRHTDS